MPALEDIDISSHFSAHWSSDHSQCLSTLTTSAFLPLNCSSACSHVASGPITLTKKLSVWPYAAKAIGIFQYLLYLLSKGHVSCSWALISWCNHAFICVTVLWILTHQLVCGLHKVIYCIFFAHYCTSRSWHVVHMEQPSLWNTRKAGNVPRTGLAMSSTDWNTNRRPGPLWKSQSQLSSARMSACWGMNLWEDLCPLGKHGR